MIRFRFMYEGREIVGPVRGNGGMVQALPRLLAAKRVAAEGRAHGLYEPAPGCVAVFPDYGAESDGEPVAVPIVGLVGEA